ncbi:MAG: WecB/TagA/CpsF family glycosyltransferase [Acidimicrobiales bacterium]|nr:WecB/TagA/CpsF family glycosyltransferase [Acidimicrobiales bacterium]
MSPPRVDVFGVRVDAQTLDGAVERMAAWIEAGHSRYVCVTGVHGVVESQDDEELRRIHNEAGMVTTDGMPLVWFSRWSLRKRFAGGACPPPVERVYGPDLMWRTFERSQTAGWRHFLFGSTPATLDRLTERVHERLPGVDIAGTHSPPYGPSEPGDEADRAAVAAIHAARPDIVWVGLSTPKQERWMAGHVGRVAAPVLVGVGAALDFHAGVKRQAPRWMGQAGLEWAFRLATEPRRLGGRYLRNNPRFVRLLAREMLDSGSRRSI